MKRYQWEQKYNTDPDWKWEQVSESDNLWHLVSQVRGLPPRIVSVSGNTGKRYLQYRITSAATGQCYSSGLTKEQCFQIMGWDIARETIEESD